MAPGLGLEVFLKLTMELTRSVWYAGTLPFYLSYTLLELPIGHITPFFPLRLFPPFLYLNPFGRAFIRIRRYPVFSIMCTTLKGVLGSLLFALISLGTGLNASQNAVLSPVD